MKNIKYVLFFLMVLAQWYIPLKMLNHQEVVIKNGTEFHFQTRPVDPYDPFRGKYIDLNFVLNSYEATYIDPSFKGVTYAELGTDAKGFAMINSLSKQAYGHNNYLKIDVKNVQGNTAYFELPFNKFFLNEDLAYTAENSVMTLNNEDKLKCFAKVMIKDGDYALQDVMLEDLSISELSRNIISGIYLKQEGVLTKDGLNYKLSTCPDRINISLKDRNQILKSAIEMTRETESPDVIYISALIDQQNMKLVYLLNDDILESYQNCLE